MKNITNVLERVSSIDLNSPMVYCIVSSTNGADFAFLQSMHSQISMHGKPAASQGHFEESEHPLSWQYRCVKSRISA